MTLLAGTEAVSFAPLNLVHSKNLDRVIIILVPTLFSFGEATANPIFHATWAVPLLLVAIKNFRVSILTGEFNSSLRKFFVEQKVFLLCVSLTGISLLRAFLTESMPFTRALGLSAFFSLTFLAILSREYFRAEVGAGGAKRDAFISLLVFAGVNFILLAVGMQSAKLLGNDRTMTDVGELSNLLVAVIHVKIPIMNFPLGRGYNAVGSIFGALIAISGPYAIGWNRPPSLRAMGAIGMLAGIVACVAVDAKGALATGVLMGVAIAVLPRFLLQLTPLTMIGLPLIPPIIFLFVNIYGLADVLKFLGITASFIAGLQERAIIWGGILLFLRHFDFIQLVGYGANGQVASGVVYTYNALIPDLDPLYMSAHDFWLQTILDIGYAGLAVFVVYYFTIFARISSWLYDTNADLAAARSSLALFVFFLALGLTEPLPLIYSPELLFIWLLATMQLGTGVRKIRLHFMGNNASSAKSNS